jgi:hypothetical protein
VHRLVGSACIKNALFLNLYLIYNLRYNIYSEWVSDCCLTPIQQLFSYIMAISHMTDHVISFKRGGLWPSNYLNPTKLDWRACAKPEKWAIICVIIWLQIMSFLIGWQNRYIQHYTIDDFRWAEYRDSSTHGAWYSPRHPRVDQSLYSPKLKFINCFQNVTRGQHNIPKLLHTH